MRLKDLAFALIDCIDSVGDCEVYLGKENECDLLDSCTIQTFLPVGGSISVLIEAVRDDGED